MGAQGHESQTLLIIAPNRALLPSIYSFLNKSTAVKRFSTGKDIHEAVITETHIREEDYDEAKLRGYMLVVTCCRQQGQTAGGVSIFLRNTRPYIQGNSVVVQIVDELGRCSDTVLPNRNDNDRLIIVGLYTPPGKKRPRYALAPQMALQG